MAAISIWGGAFNHPTRAQARVLAEDLSRHDVSYSESLDVLRAPRLRGVDLLIMSGCRYSGIAEAKFVPTWEDPASPQLVYEPLSANEVADLTQFVAGGGSLLCHHVALGSFDDRPELGELFDGRWIWGRSTHAREPLPAFTVSIEHPEHEITAGLAAFSTVDELYSEIDLPCRSTVILRAAQFGRTWPVAWVRQLGAGRIATCTLGHDMRVFESDPYRQLVRRLIDWLLTR
jgi:uncharacterized protein